MDHDYESRKAAWTAAQARMGRGYNIQQAQGLNRAERLKRRSQERAGWRGKMRREWLRGIQHVPHGRAYRAAQEPTR